MHELSLVQSMVEQVTALADQHGATCVHTISIDVGPLGNVVAELLLSAFEAFRDVEPRLRETRLSIRTIPLSLQCQACEARWEVPEPAALCPRCGGTRVTVLAGDAIMLRDVELELEEANV